MQTNPEENSIRNKAQDKLGISLLAHASTAVVTSPADLFEKIDQEVKKAPVPELPLAQVVNTAEEVPAAEA